MAWGCVKCKFGVNCPFKTSVCLFVCFRRLAHTATLHVSLPPARPLRKISPSTCTWWTFYTSSKLLHKFCDTQIASICRETKQQKVKVTSLMKTTHPTCLITSCWLKITETFVWSLYVLQIGNDSLTVSSLAHSVSKWSKSISCHSYCVICVHRTHPPATQY